MNVGRTDSIFRHDSKEVHRGRRAATLKVVINSGERCAWRELSYGTQPAEETDGGGGESMEAARVESDSRNENGAKDRVDSPEQVAGDLERER